MLLSTKCISLFESCEKMLESDTNSIFHDWTCSFSLSYQLGPVSSRSELWPQSSPLCFWWTRPSTATPNDPSLCLKDCQTIPWASNHNITQPIKPRHTHTKSCRKQSLSLCKKIDQQRSTKYMASNSHKKKHWRFRLVWETFLWLYMFDRKKLIMTVGFSPDHWSCLPCSQNVLWVICPHTGNKTDEPNLVWSRLSRMLIVILKCYA